MIADANATAWVASGGVVNSTAALSYAPAMLRVVVKTAAASAPVVQVGWPPGPGEPPGALSNSSLDTALGSDATTSPEGLSAYVFYFKRAYNTVGTYLASIFIDAAEGVENFTTAFEVCYLA